MEASERQLPIEPPAGSGSGSVRVVEDRLVIEDMTIADEEDPRASSREARPNPARSPARSVRRAIEIGTRVLDREDTAIEVDYVRREFERLTRVHSETVEGEQSGSCRADRGGPASGSRRRGGSKARSARRSSPTARSWRSRSPTPSARTARGAVQAQIKAHARRSAMRIFRRRLSADDERNPLGPIMTTLRGWARERKEDQDSRDQKLEAKVDELLNKGRGARRAGPGS